jgi:UDP-N-acetylglucosamine:LPS N-acetylglucosamine transferase
MEKSHPAVSIKPELRLTKKLRHDFVRRECRRDQTVHRGHGRAFAAADLVVGRAGMGTVSELAAAGRPFDSGAATTASDQHQLRNAEALERAGARVLIPDAELTGARLVEEVTRLSSDSGNIRKDGPSSAFFRQTGRGSARADCARIVHQNDHQNYRLTPRSKAETIHY